VTLAKHYGVSTFCLNAPPRFYRTLRIAGANLIIGTVDLAVSTMVNAIEYPQVESMMHFEQGQIEVLKLSIQKAAMLLVEALLKLLRIPGFPVDL